MSGLIVGLGFFILFSLACRSVLTYDTFNLNVDNIYGVVQVLPGGNKGHHHSAVFSAPVLPALLDEIHEIERATRYHPAGRMIVKYKDKIFYENRIKFVDSDFLSIFSFKLLSGDKTVVLSKPNSIVLTKATALKYFDEENPVGQSLTLNNKIDVIITGIVDNVPKHSSLNFDFLVSMETANSLFKWMNDWQEKNQNIFILLAKTANLQILESKLANFKSKYYPESPESPRSLYFLPLRDFFLNSNDIESYWSKGQINFIALWFIASILLIIACINFMNLSTAKHSTRAREVGIRKVVGAHRIQLVKQFLGESVLISLISLPAAIIFCEFIKPVLTTYLGDIFNISLWKHPQVIILAFFVTILTGLFAGLYPAFFLSAFKPVQVLKGNIQIKKKVLLRKSLVVTQFFFSIILILLTFISIKQHRYNLDVDLGYNKDRVFAIKITGEAVTNFSVLKNKLLQHKDITHVSAAASLPIGWDVEESVIPEGLDKDNSLIMNIYGVNHDFTELLDIEILQGRVFSISPSETENILINEKAAKQLGWDNPMGKRLKIKDNNYRIIGITNDFHFKSIFMEKIQPTVLFLEKKNLNFLFIKYSSAAKKPDIKEYLGQQWRSQNPNLPFDCTTLNDYFQQIQSGNKTAELSGIMGAMAIFISCLGLYGLCSFSMERRVKEIGIRKVLGASHNSITRELIKGFIKLVVLANLIALPIGYLLINALQKLHSYPITLGIDIFVLTALLTLIISFITVISQSSRAAKANPVDSLKFE
jgi:putative ABC transport system permease protein